MSVLTLIRAKEEDSGNYTLRVENGNQSRDVSLILEVKGQGAIYYIDVLLSNSDSHFSLSYSHTLQCSHLLSKCVTVPAVIMDLMDIHHGSATGQSVVCITRGQPTPVVEWFICKNIKQ